MRRDNADDPPRRKRRTREHVIEDLSENHLERKVLQKGHILRRTARDYGIDATMFHFAPDGGIENGEVRFQLKATDSLKVVKQLAAISFPIQTKDLHYWSLESYPFILVVFDAQRERAFWLHIQDYIEHHPDGVDPDRSTIRVHIPLKNKLTVKSIEAFRSKSLQVVDKLRSQGGFSDAGREKPR